MVPEDPCFLYFAVIFFFLMLFFSGLRDPLGFSYNPFGLGLVFPSGLNSFFLGLAYSFLGLFYYDLFFRPQQWSIKRLSITLFFHLAILESIKSATIVSPLRNIIYRLFDTEKWYSRFLCLIVCHSYWMIISIYTWGFWQLILSFYHESCFNCICFHNLGWESSCNCLVVIVAFPKLLMCSHLRKTVGSDRLSLVSNGLMSFVFLLGFNLLFSY